MDANFNIRIDQKIRDDFTRVCKKQVMTPSEVTRSLMMMYIEKYDGMPGPLDGFDPTDGGRDKFSKRVKKGNRS